MFRRVALIAVCGLLTLGLAAAQTPPAWQDRTLSADARADALQKEMTLEEQLLLLKGYYGASARLPWTGPAPVEYRPQLPESAGFVPGIPRLGIPALRETDAGVGIANTNAMRPGDTATAFPSGLSNAASWDPDLTFAIGVAIAEEARDRGYNVVLDGALNLAREPRGGRTFEYAGEDPLLAGTMVGEQVRGIQSRHIISTVKHFALNDQENGRGILSVNIDEGAARESDLLAFEIAIEHGNPGAVMCSYNRVNAVDSCENDFLLGRVLKHDWGYPGWVLSDWGGVHSTVAAANAGLDQESASGFDREPYFGSPLAAALAAGTVTPERIHDMVHRILRSMFASGLMDDPPLRRTPSTHADLAERGAEESIVLLKNDRGILPLAGTMRRIAVIGAHADIGVLSGGGSSQVLPIGYDPKRQVYVDGTAHARPSGERVIPVMPVILDTPSPLAALKAKAPHALIRYDDGYDIAAAARLAAQSDVVIVFAQQWMSEGWDVPSLSLPGDQDALIKAVAAANPHTVVVLETGGPVLMPWLGDVPAVLEAWYSGSGGAEAIARVLTGDVNPSGRLPITFPQSENQLPNLRVAGPPPGYKPFDVVYPEGADVGYRWFERQGQKPLFAFGYGLSYTTFGYADFTVNGGDSPGANVAVTNTGARDGSETVQLYATPPGRSAARLVGWSKVWLKAGETRKVTLSVEPRLLARFDVAANLWRIAAGNYTLSVRTSATDVKASATVTMTERTIKP